MIKEKKGFIYSYTDKEWQEFCKKHSAEWEAMGTKIKNIRTQLRISQNRLAREAGICARTLAKLENGKYIRRFKVVSTSCLNALIKIYQHDQIKLITTLN